MFDARVAAARRSRDVSAPAQPRDCSAQRPRNADVTTASRRCARMTLMMLSL